MGEGDRAAPEGVHLDEQHEMRPLRPTDGEPYEPPEQPVSNCWGVIRFDTANKRIIMRDGTTWLEDSDSSGFPSGYDVERAVLK